LTKPFESFLAPQLEEYMAYRQSLGYSKNPSISWLKIFDRYLKSRKVDQQILLQPSFFLELRANLKVEQQTVNMVLSATRIFFQYLIRKGYYAENPLRDVPPLQGRSFIPFVFSPEETDRLLTAACKRIRKGQKHFLRDMALYLAIVLLARCGMRISEPIRLLRHQYRSDDGTIYIEKTKFRKDRLVPVPKDVLPEIENYLAVRKALCPDDQNPYFLAGRKQRALTDNKIRSTFHQAVKDIDINNPKWTIGTMVFGSPTPHSLRHSFAINTLKQVKERGKSPQHALPVLAAYMGHLKYRYTGAYLKVSDAKHRAGLIDFVKSQQEVT